MLLQKLVAANLAHPPKWLPDNAVMMMIMGSQAYGVSTDSSDQDIYGIVIPPKELVFPHLAGEIPGFGKQIQRFENYQQHHIKDPSNQDVSYDLNIYSIVKYFQLCMENNPNMIDSLFVPRNCIIHSTAIGEMIRENRHIFLHKGSWPKFKGYAYAAINKLRGKTITREFLHLKNKYDLPLDITIEAVEHEIKKRSIDEKRFRTINSTGVEHI